MGLIVGGTRDVAKYPTMHKTSPLPHNKEFSHRVEVEMPCLKIKAFFWATPAPGKVPSDPIVLLLGN